MQQDSKKKSGLSSQQVIESQQKYGKNILTIKKPTPIFIKFLKFLVEPMMQLLILAALIALGVAIYNVVFNHNHDQIELIVSFVEPGVIFLIVILNSIFGTIQENNAQKSIDALEKLTAPISHVLRDGKIITIKSEDLTVRDILVLKAGDQITGDGEIIEAANLEVDEALLTGESLPVFKDITKPVIIDAPLAERFNYVFSGTNVTRGRALVEITAIGMNTEIGKISTLINKEVDNLTPLQKKVNKLGKWIGIFSALLCVLTFFVYLLIVANIIQTPQNFAKQWHTALLIAITLAIGTIPEGLVPIITVILSFGVKRLSKKNALVKKISSAETLGNVSVICSDKTGTLTENKMTLKGLWSVKNGFDDFTNQDIIDYALLCSDAAIYWKNNNLVSTGSATEIAILNHAYSLDSQWTKEALQAKYPRVGEIPFESERKMMTVVVKYENKYLVITKGAFDRLLPLFDNSSQQAIKANEEMSNQALRVIAIGYKFLDNFDGNIQSKILEKDLNLIGLIGIIDPPRQEAKDAIVETQKAGIKTVMITGDHKNTALAIATQLGIFSAGQKAITGEELAKLSADELENEIENIAVFARTSPLDKIRIVKAWQAKNKIVSMTGDGVNDAPALKASDIGCAMGITGTEVSKQAADLILTDDNFATIANAVKEGRRLLDNIKRLMVFLFATNFATMIVTFVGILLFAINPLSALQILWINVVGETLPGIALGLNNSQSKLMDQKPELKNSPIITKKMFFQLVSLGLLASSFSLLMYYVGAVSLYNYDYGLMYQNLKNAEIDSLAKEANHLGSALAFLTMGIMLSANAFVVRSQKSIFISKWKDIKILIFSFLASIIILIFVTYIPILNLIFHMQPYNDKYGWFNIIPFFIPLSFIAISEIMKLIKFQSKI
ncbi:cation-translocating P-type ATPase [Mycoplasma iguanae]|uniref:Cation-translocating P-type ATPase n=1 Tax=Mycoplasma iguanae TaxID=292461 RepID=A0ABY5R8P6_9MOLU|nr:cation-translocating P-type ATPase [Mycoplasma iguanae]UVD81542.1 cation-translocating P-type ATPase [Mycoplasma iguanae]